MPSCLLGGPALQGSLTVSTSCGLSGSICFSVGTGVFFVAGVLGVLSRGIVGLEMATHLRTEMVIEVLDIAYEKRRPANLIQQFGQGGQRPPVVCGRRCDEYGARSSMGSVGDGCGDAICESSFASLERESIGRFTFEFIRQSGSDSGLPLDRGVAKPTQASLRTRLGVASQRYKEPPTPALCRHR